MAVQFIFRRGDKFRYRGILLSTYGYTNLAYDNFKYLFEHRPTHSNHYKIYLFSTVCQLASYLA